MQAGGGIDNFGTLTLEAGSRVSGNVAGGGGGGIFNFSDGEVTLEAGSIVGGANAGDGNTADKGGGIFNNIGFGATVTVGSGQWRDEQHRDSAGTAATRRQLLSGGLDR